MTTSVFNTSLSQGRVQIPGNSNHFQHNWADYVTISAALATACVVNAYWGKIAAIIFGLAVASASPLFSKQLEKVTQYDLNVLSQASVAIGVAGLCFVNPLLAAGLATTLATNILKREWKLADVAKETAQNISTLQEQNEALLKFVQKFQEVAVPPEAQLTSCLNMSDTLQQAIEQQTKAADLIQQQENVINCEQGVLVNKVQGLTSFNQQVVTQKELLESAQTTEQTTQSLMLLMQTWNSTQHELEPLKGRMSSLAKVLQEAVSQGATQNSQVLEQLIQKTSGG